MKKIAFIVLVVPSLVFLAACGHKKEAIANVTATDAIPVKIMALNKQDDTTSIAVSGQFTTDDEVYLSFKTGGIINHIYVKEGDAVKKGQLLATLNLTEINAQVDQAKLTYEKATRDYQRTQSLYKDSVYTLEQLQNSKTTVDLARQQLNTAEFNLTYSEIRATANGFVLHKMVSEGQLVNSGTPVFQTNGAGAGNWVLKVGISDKEWAAIHANDKAIISLESMPGKSFEGKVVRKTEGVDAATGSFGADIQLIGEKPSSLGAGMFGRAAIFSSGEQSANDGEWVIPYDALLDGDNDAGYVFITNDNKTATKIRVTVAGIKKDQVIITDGLQSARALIISGSAYLTENSPIKIIQ